MGMIRRIGNGESTKVWLMNWLPDQSWPRSIPTDKLNSPQVVTELINHATGFWNQQTLDDFFTLGDAATIANILLNTRRQEDFWDWNHDRTGIYTVRSTYQTLIQRKAQHAENGRSVVGCSNTSAREKKWSSPWKIKVPSKVRIFLWRLAHHSLPSADVLQHRNMAPRSACALCSARDS